MGKAAHRNWLIFTGITTVLLLLLSYPIARIYIQERGDSLSMAWVAMIALAVQTPLQGLVRARISYLQRIQKARNMQMLIFVSSVLYPIVSAFILGTVCGVYGVFFCYAAGDLLTLVTIWIFYTITSHHLRPSAQEYLNLPDDFEISPGILSSLISGI